jgi:hypothetical protein
VNIVVPGQPEGKKAHETPSQQKRLGVMVCACCPSTAGSINKVDPGWPGEIRSISI